MWFILELMTMPQLWVEALLRRNFGKGLHGSLYVCQGIALIMLLTAGAGATPGQDVNAAIDHLTQQSSVSDDFYIRQGFRMTAPSGSDMTGRRVGSADAQLAIGRTAVFDVMFETNWRNVVQAESFTFKTSGLGKPVGMHSYGLRILRALYGSNIVHDFLAAKPFHPEYPNTHLFRGKYFGYMLIDNNLYHTFSVMTLPEYVYFLKYGDWPA